MNRINVSNESNNTASKLSSVKKSKKGLYIFITIVTIAIIGIIIFLIIYFSKNNSSNNNNNNNNFSNYISNSIIGQSNQYITSLKSSSSVNYILSTSTINTIQSSNGAYQATLNTYGYLIILDVSTQSQIWNSTYRNLSFTGGPYQLIMQPDGNLVIYAFANSSSPVAVWSAMTTGLTSNCEVILTNEGDLVINDISNGENNPVIIWSSFNAEILSLGTSTLPSISNWSKGSVLTSEVLTSNISFLSSSSPNWITTGYPSPSGDSTFAPQCILFLHETIPSIGLYYTSDGTTIQLLWNSDVVYKSGGVLPSQSSTNPLTLTFTPQGTIKLTIGSYQVWQNGISLTTSTYYEFPITSATSYINERLTVHKTNSTNVLWTTGNPQ